MAAETSKGAHFWSLKTSALFEGLADSVVDSAGNVAKEVVFHRGERVGDNAATEPRVHVILEGQVKLRSLAQNGKESIIDIASEGDAFGPIEELVALPDPSRQLSAFATEAVAMSNGKALSISVEEFQDLIRRRPVILINISRLLGLKQRRLEIRLARLLYRSALGKLAGMLSELAERYGTPEPRGILIPFKLTHQEMASVIGVKRETVSEGMGILELDEYLKMDKGNIVVLNRAGLDQIP